MNQLATRKTCAALVVTCSDFRFKSAERSFLEQAGLTDDYDLIARPGAARSLVAPATEAAGDTLWAEMQLLRSLHKFDRVLLVNHITCGAYAGITTPSNERDVHADHLRRAAEAVEQQLDGAHAEPYLVETADGRIAVTPIDR